MHSVSTRRKKWFPGWICANLSEVCSTCGSSANTCSWACNLRPQKQKKILTSSKSEIVLKILQNLTTILVTILRLGSLSKFEFHGQFPKSFFKSSKIETARAVDIGFMNIIQPLLTRPNVSSFTNAVLLFLVIEAAFCRRSEFLKDHQKNLLFKASLWKTAAGKLTGARLQR